MLLQIVEVKNAALYPVEIEYANRPAGTLTAAFKEITAQEQIDEKSLSCSSTDAVKDSTTELSRAFYVLPLRAGVAESIPTLLSKPTSLLTLTPSEAALVGIYGAGPELEKTFTTGWQRQTFKQSPVTTGCHASCDFYPGDDFNKFTEPQHDYRINHFLESCSQLENWSCKKSDDKCRKCMELVTLCQDSAAPPADRLSTHLPVASKTGQELLDLCYVAEWAPPEGYIRSYCPGGRATGWRLERVTTPRPLGVESGPAILELDPSKNIAKARFTLPGVGDAPEFREVPLLQAHTRQWE